MTPGIDDPLHVHDCPSYLSQLHTLSFCAAFVRHLHDLRHSHIVIGQVGVSWNTFVLGWRIPIHHGDDVQPP